MADVKLFKIGQGAAVELPAQSAQIERSLQLQFEANLESLLGVRFLATEYSTGAVHGGRIDTLGIDEDGAPVIIEYKRAVNENVINQGLFYLDWLMDHKKEFQWLVMEKLGGDVANKVEWSSPRPDLYRWRLHPVRRPRRQTETSVTPAKDASLSQRIDYRIANAPADLRDVFEATSAYLMGLGDDVQTKELKFYIAFKRIKNFACAEVYPQARVVLVFLKINPETVSLEEGFTRDVRAIGHFGTGDLQVILRTMDDLAKAQPLFQRAYEGG